MLASKFLNSLSENNFQMSFLLQNVAKNKIKQMTHPALLIFLSNQMLSRSEHLPFLETSPVVMNETRSECASK